MCFCFSYSYLYTFDLHRFSKHWGQLCSNMDLIKLKIDVISDSILNSSWKCCQGQFRSVAGSHYYHYEPTFKHSQDVLPALLRRCDTRLCLAVLCSRYMGVVPNLVKKSGVCAVMSLWLVHIKDHVWSIRICPTTILLPTLSRSCDHWRT